MKLIDIVEYDIVNYKKPAMFIGFPACSMKCNIEAKCEVCQNMSLLNSEKAEITPDEISDRYIMSPLTHAIVCGGLEPFDTWEDLQSLVSHLRKYTEDDIVIYSGYNKEELVDQINWLKQYPNIIIKFGRYLPVSGSHLDKVLGVKLASANQYAEVIS